MSELKPCPFCGGEADTGYALLDYNRWGAQCTKCGATVEVDNGYGKWEDTEQSVIKRWNRRPPAHMYTLEELREMDGERVWCDSISEITRPSQWAVYNKKFDCCSNKEWDFYINDAPFEEYDITWVAYDRPPEEE